ncbi:hypothetical protein LVJ83_10710 [Uruburuella testudinis]|uniref:Uncharacterized protein n=1 Tax=Uruburuella testudinis TaxID=1282863 RepID=A0ABY4DSN0_9NEIS|nr:hypothetical protein [Uruburuella testudinis]UOO81418.1 hypothetical protein LVJ83_10710 [Uruburuella testudinis]
MALWPFFFLEIEKFLNYNLFIRQRKVFASMGWGGRRSGYSGRLKNIGLRGRLWRAVAVLPVGRLFGLF